VSVLEFIASLVGSLAWPLAALGIAVVFRNHIKRLLSVAGPMRKLKGPGGIEAFYDSEVEETKQAAAEALQSTGGSKTTAEVAGLLMLQGLDDLADKSPAGAVVEASTRLEGRLLALLAEAGIEVAPNRGLGTIASLARKHGLIDESSYQAVLGLRVMRNLAVHGGGEALSRAQALEFLILADAVLYALRMPPKSSV